MFWILLLLWAFDVITFWKALGFWFLWILFHVVCYSLFGAVLFNTFAGLFAGFLG